LQEKKEEKERAVAKNKAKEAEKKKLIDATQASNQANFYACKLYALSVLSAVCTFRTKQFNR